MTALPLAPDYAVPAGHFDEARTRAGELRPPWAEFAASTELNTWIDTPDMLRDRPSLLVDRARLAALGVELHARSEKSDEARYGGAGPNGIPLLPPETRKDVLDLVENLRA